jgi:hypothetical protein
MSDFGRELRRRYDNLWLASDDPPPVLRRVPRGLLPFIPIAAAVAVLIIAISLDHHHRGARPCHPRSAHRCLAKP